MFLAHLNQFLNLLDIKIASVIAAKNQTPLELYKTQCEAFDVEKLTKQFYQIYKNLLEKDQQVRR